MSDIENEQETPVSEVLEQNEGSQQSEDSADSVTNEDVKSSPEPEVVTMTREEYDNSSKKIKEIAKRQARRDAAEEYEGKMAEFKVSPSAQTATPTQSYQQAPAADQVWDEYLGYIHKDTSSEQKTQMIIEAVNSMQNPSPQQPVQQPKAVPGSANANAIQASRRLEDQLISCDVEHNDFKDVVSSLNLGNEALPMFEAAATAPDGIELIYDMAKNNPSDLIKIARLSPMDQQYKMWNMQKERVNSLKKVSSASPQPEPLETNGSVNKNYADLSLSERRRMEMQKQWDK
jgi:hypothetical protein